ncbi:MAG TPA: hypothetical protein ENJ35_08525 [Gammaproteobacteria bacterium]|nr:hypothetical protein [Gammaproteobacteria bacterium]
MAIADALLIDTSNTVTDGCTVCCSGDYGTVSIQVQGDGQNWDLVLEPAEARQLIFDLHRAVMDALKEGAAA